MSSLWLDKNSPPQHSTHGFASIIMINKIHRKLSDFMFKILINWFLYIHIQALKDKIIQYLYVMDVTSIPKISQYAQGDSDTFIIKT